MKQLTSLSFFFLGYRLLLLPFLLFLWVISVFYAIYILHPLSLKQRLWEWKLLVGKAIGTRLYTHTYISNELENAELLRTHDEHHILCKWSRRNSTNYIIITGEVDGSALK